MGTTFLNDGTPMVLVYPGFKNTNLDEATTLTKVLDITETLCETNKLMYIVVRPDSTTYYDRITQTLCFDLSEIAQIDKQYGTEVLRSYIGITFREEYPPGQRLNAALIKSDLYMNREPMRSTVKEGKLMKWLCSSIHDITGLTPPPAWSLCVMTEDEMPDNRWFDIHPEDRRILVTFKVDEENRLKMGSLIWALMYGMCTLDISQDACRVRKFKPITEARIPLDDAHRLANEKDETVSCTRDMVRRMITEIWNEEE